MAAHPGARPGQAWRDSESQILWRFRSRRRPPRRHHPGWQVSVVAYFEPRNVIGRVRPAKPVAGLDGFPWAEYGSITATVTGVGSEVREGRVLVELDAQPQLRVPLQHGLPGTLEIQTERIPPALFLMRKAGGSSPSPRMQRFPRRITRLPRDELSTVAHSRGCADVGDRLRTRRV